MKYIRQINPELLEQLEALKKHYGSMKYQWDTLTFKEKEFPVFIALNRDAVIALVKAAIKSNSLIVPLSSRESFHKFPNKAFYYNEGEKIIILDLSHLSQIVRVDRKNRVIALEPGVTFGDLFPALKKEGLRLSHPLFPEEGRSVLTTYLEKYPVLLSRYHWDTLDPLSCIEVITGTGDLLRTGSAAGPGSIEEQWEAGQAQVNPMGPTQFSPVRVFHGAMGTLGVVTWASIRVELSPSVEEPLLFASSDLGALLSLLQYIVKMRFGDEVFLMDKSYFSRFLLHHDVFGETERVSEGEKRSLSLSFLSSRVHDIYNSLPAEKYYLLVNLSGKGYFPEKRVLYQKRALEDFLASKDSIIILTHLMDKSLRDYLQGIFSELSYPSLESVPWNHVPLPSQEESEVSSEDSFYMCKELFFLSHFEQAEHLLTFMENFESFTEEFSHLTSISLYVQPLVQGSNLHVQWDFHFKGSSQEFSDNLSFKQKVEEEYKLALESLDKKYLLYYSRPYGEMRRIYNRLEKNTLKLFAKVKLIFDPHNILNRGVIPYEDFL